MVLRESVRQDGQAIRRLRQHTGVKVSELADQVGVAAGTLHNIENGHNTASIEVLHRIARQLDVDVQQLLAADLKAAS